MRSTDTRTMTASPVPSCGLVAPLAPRSMTVHEDKRAPVDTGLVFPNGRPILRPSAPLGVLGFYPLKERR